MTNSWNAHKQAFSDQHAPFKVTSYSVDGLDKGVCQACLRGAWGGNLVRLFELKSIKTGETFLVGVDCLVDLGSPENQLEAKALLDEHKAKVRKAKTEAILLSPDVHMTHKYRGKVTFATLPGDRKPIEVEVSTRGNHWVSWVPVKLLTRYRLMTNYEGHSQTLEHEINLLQRLIGSTKGVDIAPLPRIPVYSF
jgi:hypothetical protein